MQFKELEITEELIKRFNKLETKKIKLFEILDSKKTTFDDLQALSYLLKREEIPLLKIVIKELDYLLSYSPKTNAVKDTLNKIKKVKKAAFKFLRRAEKDESKVSEILEKVISLKDPFYQERPLEDKETSELIRKLIKSLHKDIKLEEKSSIADANKILTNYLTAARYNFKDSRIIRIAKYALKYKRPIVKIAACFLITVSAIACEKKEPPGTEKTTVTQTATQTVQIAKEPNSVPYKVQKGDNNATKIYVKSNYPQLNLKTFLDETKILTKEELNQDIKWTKMLPGDILRIPYQKGMTLQKPNPFFLKSGNYRAEAPVITLARTTLGEAEGYDYESKLSVVAVVLQRKESPSFPNNFHNILLQRRAFPCLIEGDPQYSKKVLDPITYNPKEWKECEAIAKMAITNPKGVLNKFHIPFAFHYRDKSVKELGNPYLKVGENKAFNFYVARQDKLSPNFRVREFACRCGCKNFKIDPLLIQKLEQLRALAGKKILINSGYRCPKHNAKVSKTEKSQHTRGTAADIIIDSLTVQQMKELAEQVGFGGIGLYPTDGFIHVDVRQGRARW